MKWKVAAKAAERIENGRREHSMASVKRRKRGKKSSHAKLMKILDSGRSPSEQARAIARLMKKIEDASRGRN
jgi:hypothetical protein